VLRRERERERERDTHTHTHTKTMASGEANAVENHNDAVQVELPAPHGWKKMVRSLCFSLSLNDFSFWLIFCALICFLYHLFSNLVLFCLPVLLAYFASDFLKAL
jgi:hypothetical protein